MMNKKEIEEFYNHVEQLGLKFPVAMLAEATGESKGNVSKYLNKRLEPSESFLKRYYAKFPKSSTNVSHETIMKESDAFYGNAYKDKYIQSLERENARLQKDLDLSLSEARHNALLTRAIAETTQELLIEFLAGKNKKAYEVLADSASIKNGEKYKRMKEEGNFAHVGK